MIIRTYEVKNIGGKITKTRSLDDAIQAAKRWKGWVTYYEQYIPDDFFTEPEKYHHYSIEPEYYEVILDFRGFSKDKERFDPTPTHIKSCCGWKRPAEVYGE
jgi:hypothetical protein